MDQPINQPSQFISLRWRCCRDPKIQNIPFRVPKSCETSDPFIPPRFPASPPLHKKRIISPVILSINPCRINEQMQIKSKQASKQAKG